MQQSIRVDKAINKQSTGLDKEKEKKGRFIFAFFSSFFDPATITTEKELEKAAAREPVRIRYRHCLGRRCHRGGPKADTHARSGHG